MGPRHWAVSSVMILAIGTNTWKRRVPCLHERRSEGSPHTCTSGTSFGPEIRFGEYVHVARGQKKPFNQYGGLVRPAATHNVHHWFHSIVKLQPSAADILRGNYVNRSISRFSLVPKRVRTRKYRVYALFDVLFCPLLSRFTVVSSA